MRSSQRVRALLLAGGLLLGGAAGCAGVPSEPKVLAPVSQTFAAPFDAVWDATLRSLGIVRLLVADKAAGRIETEVFPFTFVVGGAPTRLGRPALLASRDPGRIFLAQEAPGGDKATQVVWIAMDITVAPREGNATDVRVVPRVHHSLLPDFMPGPPNSPWDDLFAKIRGHLSLRG